MGITFLIFLIVVFAAMWIFFIRPQKRRQQAQQQMLQNVGPGDEILTAGGFYATVVDAGDDEELTIELAPGTHARLARRAVAAIIPPDEPEDELEDAEELQEIGAGGSAEGGRGS